MSAGTVSGSVTSSPQQQLAAGAPATYDWSTGTSSWGNPVGATSTVSGQVLPASGGSGYNQPGFTTTPGLIGGYSATQRQEAGQYLQNAYLDAERQLAGNIYNYNSPVDTNLAIGQYLNGTQPWTNSIQTVASSQNFQGLTNPGIVGPGNIYDTSQWYTEGWGSPENGNAIASINNPYVPYQVQAEPVAPTHVPGVSAAGGNASGLPGVWSLPGATLQPGYQTNQDGSTSPFNYDPYGAQGQHYDPDWNTNPDPRSVSGKLIDPDGLQPYDIPYMPESGNPLRTPYNGGSGMELSGINYQQDIPGWDYLDEGTRQQIMGAMQMRQQYQQEAQQYQQQYQQPAAIDPNAHYEYLSPQWHAQNEAAQQRQWAEWAYKMQDPAFAASYNAAMNPVNYNPAAPANDAGYGTGNTNTNVTAFLPTGDENIINAVPGRYVNPASGAQQTAAASMEAATRTYENAMRLQAMRGDVNTPYSPEYLTGWSLNQQAQDLRNSLYAAAGANYNTFTRY